MTLTQLMPVSLPHQVLVTYIQFLSEYIDNQIGMVAFRGDIQLGEQPSRERNAIHDMYQRIQ